MNQAHPILIRYPDCEFVVYRGEYHDLGVTTLLLWRYLTEDQRTVGIVFESLAKAQRFAERLNADKAKMHLPTGAPCRVLRTEGDRSYCDFYGRAYPFTWVMNKELA